MTRALMPRAEYIAMMPGTRPRPEDYPTAWSYWQASRVWRKRTGGSLIATVALALIVGGLSGSAVLAILTLVGSVGVHL